MEITKRNFLLSLGATTASLVALSAVRVKQTVAKSIEKISMTKAEWREQLTPAQYDILRNEGTERPFTSPLNDEKREGTYHCIGCELALFDSNTKYDSGTGWPSFWDFIPGHVETKTDFKLIYPRTEYHCAQCEGHQGHVFKDGPAPTGLRYCNNGVALYFEPTA